MSDSGASAGSAPAATRTAASSTGARAPRLANHPILRLTLVRTGLGLVTILIVSIVVFAATQVLPGDAAYAVLGHYATEARVRAVEAQLHLNRPAVVQSWDWLTGVLTGHFGVSLADGVPVSSLVGPRIANSAVLVLLSGVIGTTTELRELRFRATSERIPTLPELFARLAGKVPLICEIKSCFDGDSACRPRRRDGGDYPGRSR